MGAIALLAGLLGLAQPAGAQAPVWPRLPDPVLPLDERIAPDGFAMDDAAEPVDPAALSRALGQDYVPRPAIWRIRDADTTIYLFATIHMLPPGFLWRSPALERVVREAGTLILESVSEPEANRAALAAVAADPAAPRLPLIERADPADRARLAALVATLPAQVAARLDASPTWIAAMAVGLAREMRAGNLPGPGADDWLEANFRATRKPVEAIEHGPAILATVTALPEAQQRAMLTIALAGPEPDVARLRAPLHAWARGDVGPGSILRIDLTRTAGTRALDEPLLAARNRAWVASLRARMARPGVMLFAAGAGHFVGPGSVIDLLGRTGLVVERVD